MNSFLINKITTETSVILKIGHKINFATNRQIGKAISPNAKAGRLLGKKSIVIVSIYYLIFKDFKVIFFIYLILYFKSLQKLFISFISSIVLAEASKRLGLNSTTATF